jgi:Nif-specific regulatory protein
MLPPSLQTAEQTHTATLPGEGANLETLVNAYEREIIIDALKRQRGNATSAARLLRTTPRIINYRILHLGIDAKSFKV